MKCAHKSSLFEYNGREQGFCFLVMETVYINIFSTQFFLSLALPRHFLVYMVGNSSDSKLITSSAALLSPGLLTVEMVHPLVGGSLCCGMCGS